MFVKTVGHYVMIFNCSMQLVKEFKDAEITIEKSRVLIKSKKSSNVLCDMPLESTSILYQ